MFFINKYNEKRKKSTLKDIERGAIMNAWKRKEWSNSETSLVCGSELKGQNDNNGMTTWERKENR